MAVDRRRPKHLVLILAREFASNLATPMLIADADGRLVYYNEAAESIVGRSFAEVGELPVDEWTTSFEPRTADAEPLPANERPVRIALDERRATHRQFVVTGGGWRRARSLRDGVPAVRARGRVRGDRGDLLEGMIVDGDRCA